MSTILDTHGLNAGSVVTINAAEKITSNVPLTQALPLPLELLGFVYSGVLNGTPIANALITVYNLLGEYVASTYTDDKGHYSFTTLSAGAYKISASKSGYASSGLLPITLVLDTGLLNNFVLTAVNNDDRIIYGKLIVEGLDDATPLDARINVINEAGNIVASTKNLNNGDPVTNREFAISELLSDTPYVVVISAAGYATQTFNVTLTAAEPSYDITATLVEYDPPADKGSISGVITDATLQLPLNNAWVGLYKIVSNNEELLMTTITDLTGYYAFLDIEPGTYVVKSKTFPII